MAPPSGNTSRPGRLLAILVAVVVVLFLAIVGGNAFQPAHWGKDFKVKLGLDLTSGTTVALRADRPKGVDNAAMAADMTIAKNIMQNRVDGAGLSSAQVQQQGSNYINVSVPGASPGQVVNLVGTTAKMLFRQILLAAPNEASEATPTPTPTTTPTPTPSATASTKASSTAKPTPSSTAKSGALGAPGQSVGNPEMARQAIALTAAATKASASPSPTPSGKASATATPTPTPTPTSTSGVSTVADAQGTASLVSAKVQALFNKLNCASKNWQKQVGYTNNQYDTPNQQIVSCGYDGSVLYKFALDKSTVLGDMIKSASAGLASTSVYWQVTLNFKSDGAKNWGTLTSAMYSKYGNGGSNPNFPLDYLAVELDGTVISSPYVQGAMTTGSALISGNFSQSQATQLSNQLSYGALPLTFVKESVNSVSPQLGSDQLHAGLLAGLIGLLLVVCYCLLYYRGLAVVAVSSLIIASVLVYESVLVLGKYEGLALELAGVAGLIVAIGITADSFVVFFERLRDEVRDGRTLRTAVERGWKRARRTILVSDTVSFLAAALLYYFSIGDVRGFAFTLGLTTLVDIVVVFLFTKPMVTILARTTFFGQGHPLSGLDPARLGARAPWRSSGGTRVTATTPAKEA